MNRESECERRKVFYGVMFALCLAGAGTVSVEAAEPKAPTLQKPKPNCSRACGRIKVTQSDGKTVQCGGAAQGGSAGCLCKCGDTVIGTTPK